MASPGALAGGSMALSGASSIVGAYGAYKSGQAKQQMYEYQSAIALRNADIAKQNADYSVRVGETQAQAQGMKTRFAVGSTIASRGASGLDVNRGSNARVVESVQEIGEHDASVIRSDAAKRAYGYEVEAANATAQGQVYQMAGDEAYSAGKIQAISTLLGGAGSVSSKWGDANQRGIF